MTIVDDKIEKSNKHFKMAMDVLVIMCIILPFVQIFFGVFKWSNFFSSLSIASSMTIATVFFKRTITTEGYKVKMNSFIYLVWSIPLVVIGTIVGSYYSTYLKTLLDIFPIYMMMPLIIYMTCLFKCIYKSLETECSKHSILDALELEKKDYAIVMNFSDGIFYEIFGKMKVFIGTDTVADSTLHVNKISQKRFVDKVSEMTETPVKELTVDHFTITEMTEI